MDLHRTQLSGLLNNSTHQKARYVALLHKLLTLLNLNKDHKLILSSLGKLIITSQPSELYKHVNYRHPVLKILTEYISKLPKSPANSAFFVDALKSLVEEVIVLLDNGIKPKRISDIFKDAVFRINVSKKGDASGDIVPDALAEYIREVVSNDHISDLLIDSIRSTGSFNAEKIRMAKIATGSLESSYRLDGIVINRGPDGRVKELSNTSVAIYNCPLDITRTELKGTLLFQGHEELLQFSKDETEHIREAVESLNTNIVIVSGKTDPIFLEFVDRRNILVLKVFNKFDLKRICDSVGGSIYNNLGPVQHKGFAKEVAEFSDAGYTFTRIIGSSDVSTLVLKSSIIEIADEYERIISNLLENLSRCTDFSVSDASFYDEVVKSIGRNSAVEEFLCKAIMRIPVRKMLLDNQVVCLKYAIEFIAVVLEVDDYLIAKQDVLDVKPPKPDGHWDEDH